MASTSPPIGRLGRIGQVDRHQEHQLHWTRPFVAAGYAPYLTLFERALRLKPPSPSGHDPGRDVTVNGRGVYSSLVHTRGSLP